MQTAALVVMCVSVGVCVCMSVCVSVCPCLESPFKICTDRERGLTDLGPSVT